jgi:predicted Zn finger-like uncharacterized protein
MSFITRCPSCGTAFKVVADQLKIADGWVRCGRCQHVFDATQDLQPAEPPTPSDLPHKVTPTEVAADDVKEELAPDVADSHETASPSADAFALQSPQSPEKTSESAPPGAPSSGGSLPNWSFVRQARRRAFWRRPWVRATLILAALGLTASLLGQAVWHWRDTLAARYPESRPGLQVFCEVLGCTITPPRRPQDVVIEGSVLLRRAPDRYSFHLVVRNHADIEIAAPALELTLTDAQDRVLVRRVWLPAEWPQPRATLAPGQEWPLQFELAFDHPQAARMAGYRAVLFYP